MCVCVGLRDYIILLSCMYQELAAITFCGGGNSFVCKKLRIIYLKQDIGLYVMLTSLVKTLCSAAFLLLISSVKN